MGEFVARNMLGRIKKFNKRKNCCILLVVYIVVLKQYTVTQTSSLRRAQLPYKLHWLTDHKIYFCIFLHFNLPI